MFTSDSSILSIVYVSKIVYVNNKPFFYFSEAKHGLEALKILFYNHVRDIDQSLAEQQ